MAKPTDCQYKLVSLFDITLGFYLRMCNLLVTVLLLYPEAANQYFNICIWRIPNQRSSIYCNCCFL